MVCSLGKPHTHTRLPSIASLSSPSPELRSHLDACQGDVGVAGLVPCAFPSRRLPSLSWLHRLRDPLAPLPWAPDAAFLVPLELVWDRGKSLTKSSMDVWTPSPQDLLRSARATVLEGLHDFTRASRIVMARVCLVYNTCVVLPYGDHSDACYWCRAAFAWHLIAV